MTLVSCYFLRYLEFFRFTFILVNMLICGICILFPLPNVYAHLSLLKINVQCVFVVKV